MTHSTELLARIANGDSAALSRCIETHRGLVRAIARRFARGEAEIDDAVQDVFVDVWRSAARYDGRVSERTFIGMIARRRLIDRLRRKNRRPITEPLVEPAASTAGAAVLEARGEALFAAKHIRRLRPAQARVLLLSAVEGMSHREISLELGLPLGTVKAHAKRGVDQLRRALATAA